MTEGKDQGTALTVTGERMIEAQVFRMERAMHYKEWTA